MSVTFSSEIHGRCPINGAWDYYGVEIVSDGSCFIAAEKIEEILDCVRGVDDTQEDIVEAICDCLTSELTNEQYESLISLSIEGRHGQNMHVEVRASF